jgi:hypothetical protein
MYLQNSPTTRRMTPKKEKPKDTRDGTDPPEPLDYDPFLDGCAIVNNFKSITVQVREAAAELVPAHQKPSKTMSSSPWE